MTNYAKKITLSSNKQLLILNIMEKEQILAIDVQALLDNSLGSFGDLYCRFAVLRNRLEESENLLSAQRNKLAEDYKIFRDEVARRVEICRQMVCKRYKYDVWHKEIKAFYEMLPPVIGV